jgi:hypothetical protein
MITLNKINCMKSINAAFFIALLLIACTKERINENTQSNASAINNAIKDDNTIPLNDLGTNTYKGYVGGLYPNGMNSPTNQYAADLLSISSQIVPLDTSGNAISNGKIVFISLGSSIGGHTMQVLKTKTDTSSITNPKLKLINCNNGYGSGSLNSIANPADPYWDHVTKILTGTKSSYKQVQVIYLETDDSSRSVTWPARPNIVKNDIENCMRVFKKKFKNVKLVYLLGRTRTFGNQRPWNREPSPYYLGWGCKWAIEDQINGVPGTEYKGPNAVAPMITWGFYKWAEMTPRKTDDFYWLLTETSDGLHATDRGQDTLATRFQTFLLTDKYAGIWYAKH